MNCSRFAAIVQLALLIGAFTAGTWLSRSIPSPYQEPGFAPSDSARSVAAPMTPRQATIRDASNDLTGIEVDVRRLNYIRSIS